jgi:hypothetical protein
MDKITSDRWMDLSLERVMSTDKERWLPGPMRSSLENVRMESREMSIPYHYGRSVISRVVGLVVTVTAVLDTSYVL